MTALPTGPFGAILADPPWHFRTWNGKKAVPNRTPVDHYSTMRHEELAALPVLEAAAPDCALFMWAVDSHLDAAIELGRGWGFRFVTQAFVWVKTGSGSTEEDPRPAMGLGYWTRKESEVCLLFTRGRPRRLSGGVRQVILAPRREHSRKPDQQYERIEQLVGGPYLEMFSRTEREGWSAWGNQVGKFGQIA